MSSFAVTMYRSGGHHFLFPSFLLYRHFGSHGFYSQITLDFSRLHVHFRSGRSLEHLLATCSITHFGLKEYGIKCCQFLRGFWLRIDWKRE